MKNIKGFTLSEVMVTITILGVLAAILIPAVVNVSPDSSKILLKKANVTLERAVSDLISNDLYYPADQTDDDSNGVKVSRGFNYTNTVGMGLPSSNDKFCYLLSQELNTVSANCTAVATGTAPNIVAPYTFTTTDGMLWTINDTTATAFTLSPGYYTTVGTTPTLTVDVSGATKGDNCYYDTCAATKKADRFYYCIRYDGKMTIKPLDTAAVAILTNPTDNKK